MTSTTRLHHVGIVVPDEERAAELMQLLGLEPGRRQYVPRYGAQCIFTRGPGAALEFIVAAEGPLAAFNGGLGGLHHVALEVDDLEQTARSLADLGISLLEPEPLEAGPIRINFLPPHFTRGVTVEFVDRLSPASGDGPA